MVELSMIDMYRIVNESVLRVANDMVEITLVEEDEKLLQARLVETPFSLAERRDRLVPVVVGHNLMQYTNKFYSINLKSSEVCWLDILIDLNKDDIDLSDIGGIHAV